MEGDHRPSAHSHGGAAGLGNASVGPCGAVWARQTGAPAAPAIWTAAGKAPGVATTTSYGPVAVWITCGQGAGGVERG